MKENHIKKEIKTIVVKLFDDTGFQIDVIDCLDLIDDLGMDSITFISLIVEIESLFKITIPDDLLLMDKFNNIDNISLLVEKILGE